jgi:hypothetical protein
MTCSCLFSIRHTCNVLILQSVDNSSILVTCLVSFSFFHLLPPKNHLLRPNIYLILSTCVILTRIFCSEIYIYIQLNDKTECTTHLKNDNDKLQFSDSPRRHTNISFLHRATSEWDIHRNLMTNIVTDCGLVVTTQKTTLNSLFYHPKDLIFHINTIISLTIVMVPKGLLQSWV